MRPIFPVADEEPDVGTPIERMSGVQDRTANAVVREACPRFSKSPPIARFRHWISKSRWLTLRTKASLGMDYVRGPMTVKRLSSMAERMTRGIRYAPSVARKASMLVMG